MNKNQQPPNNNDPTGDDFFDQLDKLHSDDLHKNAQSDSTFEHPTTKNIPKPTALRNKTTKKTKPLISLFAKKASPTNQKRLTVIAVGATVALLLLVGMAFLMNNSTPPDNTPQFTAQQNTQEPAADNTTPSDDNAISEQTTTTQPSSTSDTTDNLDIADAPTINADAIVNADIPQDETLIKEEIDRLKDKDSRLTEQAKLIDEQLATLEELTQTKEEQIKLLQAQIEHLESQKSK